MSPALVAVILEFVFKLIELWISKREEGESLTMAEQKALDNIDELIGMVQPYMTQRQHRRYDARIRKVKALLGE